MLLLDKIICYSIIDATEKAYSTIPFIDDCEWSFRMRVNYNKMLNHKPSKFEKFIRKLFDTTIGE